MSNVTSPYTSRFCPSSLHFAGKKEKIYSPELGKHIYVSKNATQEQINKIIQQKLEEQQNNNQQPFNSPSPSSSSFSNSRERRVTFQNQNNQDNLAPNQDNRIIARPPRRRSAFQKIVWYIKRHPVQFILGSLTLIAGGMFSSRNNQLATPSFSFSQQNKFNPASQPPTNTFLPTYSSKAEHKSVIGKFGYVVGNAPAHLPVERQYSLQLSDAWMQHVRDIMGSSGVKGLNQRLPVEVIIETDKAHTNPQNLRAANRAGGNQGITILDRVSSSDVLQESEKSALIVHLKSLGAQTAREIAQQAKKKFQDID